MFPPDLPRVSNRPLYVYRVLIKLLSFFVFGVGTLLLAIMIFPPMRLVLHPVERFKKYGRRFVSVTMKFFVSFMHFLGIVDVETCNREIYRHLSSKIIVANHPSLLDTVIFLSLIPNADCIVSASYKHNIIMGVVKQLYIINSLDFNDLLKACNDSLEHGNCLIIFPEGTRTPRTGKVIIKKGAARIALDSGCGIIPVHIGGTDKYGLGKKDPWTGFNPRERYVYRLTMGAEINPEKYRSFPTPGRRVRALTREIQEILFPRDRIPLDKIPLEKIHV